MFSFLPPEQKAFVSKQYRQRVLFVGFLFTALVFICGTALLMPTYVTLSIKDTAIAAGPSDASKGTPSDGSIEGDIRDVQGKIGVLKRLAAPASMVSVLERVLAKKEPGVSISNMAFRRSDTGGSITLDGVGATREALVAFSKNLQAESSFSDVVLPVSTFAKSKDIGFSITLNFKS